MKRYITSNNQDISEYYIRLSDTVVYSDDITTYQYAKVYASKKKDYSLYTDEQLLSMSKKEMSHLDNDDIDTIERIAKLDKTRLTEYQMRILIASNRKKLPLTRRAIDDILETFKRCDDVARTIYRKTESFKRKHHMTNRDILMVLHALDRSDFKYKMKSTNQDHLCNEIAVFVTDKTFVFEKGDIIEGLTIYAKIDLTETDPDGDGIVVISFHSDEENNE